MYNMRELVSDIKYYEDMERGYKADHYVSWDVKSTLTVLYSARAQLRGRLHMAKLDLETLVHLVQYPDEYCKKQARSEGKCQLNWSMEDQAKLVERVLGKYYIPEEKSEVSQPVMQ